MKVPKVIQIKVHALNTQRMVQTLLNSNFGNGDDELSENTPELPAKSEEELCLNKVLEEFSVIRRQLVCMPALLQLDIINQLKQQNFLSKMHWLFV